MRFVSAIRPPAASLAPSSAAHDVGLDKHELLGERLPPLAQVGAGLGQLQTQRRPSRTAPRECGAASQGPACERPAGAHTTGGLIDPHGWTSPNLVAATFDQHGHPRLRHTDAGVRSPGPAADAAVAFIAFAAQIGLLVAIPEPGASDITTPTILLAALSTLPLLGRRVAPLPVFVAAGLGSIALRVVAEPSGPPIGPTIALDFLAASTSDSRPSKVWSPLSSRRPRRAIRRHTACLSGASREPMSDRMAELALNRFGCGDGLGQWTEAGPGGLGST